MCLQDVLAFFKDSKFFHIIAYSFGSCLALKFAEKLESLGKVGHVTFIDGAPMMTRAFAQQHYKENSDEYIQNHIVESLLTSLHVTLDTEYAKNILALPTWNEKVEVIVDLIKAQNVYGKEYLVLMLNALANRIKITLNFPDKLCMLESTTATLIRPVASVFGEFKEDYGLDLNFKKKIEVRCLEANHFSILESPQLIENLNHLHSCLKIN